MTVRPAVKDEAAAHRFAKDHLKAFVERIERLEEEKKALADDIRDVYQEAKGNGFDVKALRQVVKLRKQDANERAEQEMVLEIYLQALGMLGAETRARVEAIDRHGKKMLAELDRAAQACAAAPDETLQRDRSSDHPSRSGVPSAGCGSEHMPASSPEGTAGLQGDHSTEAAADAAAPIERAGGGQPSPAANPPSPPTGTSLGHMNVIAGGDDQPRPDDRQKDGPDVNTCPGGADEHQSPPSGGDRPRPVPQNPPGGAAEDLLEIPPDLRRDASNIAPYMRRVPGEPRAPP